MTPEEEKEFERRAEGFLNEMRELTGYNLLLNQLEAILVRHGLMQPIQRDLIKRPGPRP